MNKNRTHSLITTALLVALSVIIPMTFPQVPLPQPFSATLASHVPVMLAMFISPWTALAVVIGSAIGFFARLGVIVSMRAASHIVFVLIGCFMLKKKYNLLSIILITMLFHALMEALVVLAFGKTMYMAAYVTGVGTMIHHVIDFTVTYIVIKALLPAKIIPPVPPLLRK